MRFPCGSAGPPDGGGVPGAPERGVLSYSMAFGTSPDRLAENLRANWPLLPVMLGVYLSEPWHDNWVSDGPFNIFKIVLGMIFSALLLGAAPSVREDASRLPAGLKAFSGATALGLAWARYSYARMAVLDIAEERAGGVPSAILGAYIAACCFLGTYFCCCWLLRRISGVLSRTGYRAFRPEIALAAAASVLVTAAGAGIGSLTVLTHHPTLAYDAMWAFDTTAYVHGAVFAKLAAGGNDVIQMLFGLFALPSAGIPYLLQALSGGSYDVLVYALGFFQALCIGAGFSFLGHAMGLEGAGRACWTAFCCCTFPFFLFSVGVEQYAASFFYCALLAMSVSRSGTPGRFEAWAAGGTLATSLALLAAARPERRVRLRELARAACGTALDVLAVASACFQFMSPDQLAVTVISRGSFAGAADKVSKDGLTGFAGLARQAVMMVRSVLVAPPSGPEHLRTGFDLVAMEWFDPDPDFLVWWAKPVASFSVLGLALVLAALAGYVLCRKEGWARTAFAWSLFAAFCTAGIGYGSADNEMTLYALYFGWGFLCLASGLLRKASRRVLGGKPLPVPALAGLTAAACAAMLAHDVPVYVEMVRFGIERYPA